MFNFVLNCSFAQFVQFVQFAQLCFHLFDLFNFCSLCFSICFNFFGLFFVWFCLLGKQQRQVSSIDAGLSKAVMDSSKLTMTKNYVGGNISEATITAEKNAVLKRKSTDLWPLCGHFKTPVCDDFSLTKSNMPELTLIYVNLASLSYKNDEKIYYADQFILWQITPLDDLPVDFSSYELKPDKVKTLRPKYDLFNGQFRGLVETLGFLTVRGNHNASFFDYGYHKENSKFLYSTGRMRIADNFSGAMFTRNKRQYESGRLSNISSRLYYLLLITTDRSGNINQYLGHVFLKPIDVEECEFEKNFDLSMLNNSESPEREVVEK